MARNAAVSGAATSSADRFHEFALLGLLASGYLAVAGSGYLDGVTVFLTGAGLLLRAVLSAGLLRMNFSGGLTNALTIAYAGFYPIDYAFLSEDFLQATVHLVFFVAVLRILTAKTERDYVYVKIIAFGEMLAASLLSSNLNYFVFLALFLLFGVATFASSEIRRSSQSPGAVARGGVRLLHGRLGALAVCATIGILAMTAGLFFLLPRTARAAFQHLASERFHLPGFSNQVTLGQIGQIQRQSATVMHARLFNTDELLKLKWRGAVLSEFDGKRWYNQAGTIQRMRVESGLLRLASENQRRRPGRRVSYEVNLKGTSSDALFLAGIPEFLRVDAAYVIRSAGGTYRLGYMPSNGLRYGVYSYLGEDMPAALPAGTREVCLRLPALDPRIARLTREVTAGQSGEAERAQALEQFLRSNYGYTLDLLPETVPDPLAHFLFDRRKGHCEYFAAAMAVMLRTAKIPSRVVTGFQSGTYNPISGWYVIRTSDAHSWVEAFLPGRGWVEFDPTPPNPLAMESTLWSRLALYVDAAETFWQDWVLNYDMNRQLLLASRVEQSGRSLRSHWLERARATLDSWWTRLRIHHEIFLGAFVGLVALAAGGLVAPGAARWWRARRRLRRVLQGTVDVADATLLYRHTLALLARRGFVKQPAQTPAEFATQIPAAGDSVLVSELTAAYNELRFGCRPDAAPRLLGLLRQLERNGHRRLTAAPQR